MVQAGTEDGRDHHPNAFSMWMAGGGIKPGITLGETDEFGFNVTQDEVHVHDLHATLLHLLGFDHKKLDLSLPGTRLSAHRRARKSSGQASSLALR